MNALSPARHLGESFENYKARRRAVNVAVKFHLKGRMFHESTRYIAVPDAPEQARMLLERGALRDKKEIVAPNGKPLMIARTKGITYRKPKKEKE